MERKEEMQELPDNEPILLHTCNNCMGLVETKYHCTQCKDFYLCVQCYDKDGHQHNMERTGFDLIDKPLEEQKTDPLKARLLGIKRCIGYLTHACQCHDENCKTQSCQKMKRVIMHTNLCIKKATGGCFICKQLIALSCCHAKYCLEPKCRVPFCLGIKDKIKHKQLVYKLEHAQFIRMSIAEHLLKQREQQQEWSSHQVPSQQPQEQSQPLLKEPKPVDAPQQVQVAPLTVTYKNPTYKAPLERLLELVKAPNTPEQQDQIIQLLEMNPQLIATYVRQRQTCQHEMQQDQNTDEPPAKTPKLNESREGETMAAQKKIQTTDNESNTYELILRLTPRH